MALLKILLYSQKNTCARVSFYFIKKRLQQSCFLSFVVKIPSNYIKYMFNIFQIASFFFGRC